MLLLCRKDATPFPALMALDALGAGEEFLEVPKEGTLRNSSPVFVFESQHRSRIGTTQNRSTIRSRRVRRRRTWMTTS